jgi:transcriptional regulator with XRE-family HTH domain
VQSFGERLKARYEAMGFNQERFAEKVGVTPGAVSQWVSGSSNLTMPRLIRIAEVLHVQVDYLLRGTGDKATIEIPYSGYVGLGGQVNRFTDGKPRTIKGFPVMVDAPAVAIRVQDESMAPAYRNGDILLVPVDMLPPDKCLGADTIVRLRGDDGREMLRRVMPGTRAGFYSLVSYGGGSIEAEIEGGRPVLARALAGSVPNGE